MIIKKLVMLSLGLLVSAFASANVIYQWETLSTSPTITSAIGQIEITDAAWQSGSASYATILHCDPAPCSSYGDPLSPIVRFYFTVNTTSSPADIDLNLVNATGLKSPQEPFSANFTIVGSHMNLNLSANTGETDMRMDNNTITRFGSDAPYFGIDCFVRGCSGATGQWVQVPEPATIALFGFGLLGMGAAKRKSAKHKVL